MLKNLIGEALCLSLFFLSFIGFGQSTLGIKTGFKAPGYTGGFIESYNENYILYFYGLSKDGTQLDEVPYVLINKQTLAITDTLFIRDETYNDRVALLQYATTSAGTVYYGELGYAPNGVDMYFSVYHVNDSLEIGALQHTTNLPNRTYNQLGFANDEFIVCTEDWDHNERIYHFNVVDTLGQTQISRTYDSSDTTSPLLYLTSRALEPLAMPGNDHAFIITHGALEPYFNVLDQNTLEILKVYVPDSYGNNGSHLIKEHEVLAIHGTQVDVDEKGIIVTGRARTFPFWLSDNDLTTTDDQGIWLRQNWDSTVEVKLFGDKTVNDRVWGYDKNIQTGIEVVTGCTPFEVFESYTKPHEREVFVVVFDYFGEYDTIWLFGNLNHIPIDLLVEDNGDVFVTGAYSDYKTDDSVSVWITKIPGIAVGLIEQEKITNRLFLYPNPTVNQLNIEDAQKYLHGEYTIYSQTGSVQQSGSFTHENIDVSSFVPGAYILSITSRTGKMFSSIFVKE